MPIEFKEGQAVIHCKGDILVIPFRPKQEALKEVAWCLLQEREEGEIGRRSTKKQVDNEMCLNEQPGVFIVADNYRSLDMIIEVLTSLRNDLALIEEKKKLQANNDIPQKVKFYNHNGGQTFASGLEFSTIGDYKVAGKGTVRVCRWPKDVKPFNIAGMVVKIDGDLYSVVEVECLGKIKPGDRIGIIAVPFKQRADYGIEKIL